MPSTRGLVGAAGEYYVAAELSRRDWLATVTIKNSPGTDVLAQRLDRRRIVAIQTKAASPGSHFRLNVKDEEPAERDNEWYVLVSLGGEHERAASTLFPATSWRRSSTSSTGTGCTTMTASGHRCEPASS